MKNSDNILKEPAKRRDESIRKIDEILQKIEHQTIDYNTLFHEAHRIIALCFVDYIQEFPLLWVFFRERGCFIRNIRNMPIHRKYFDIYAHLLDKSISFQENLKEEKEV